jgi:succinate dehydrogenase (ubiquinone) membrane anchor subunit
MKCVTVSWSSLFLCITFCFRFHSSADSSKAATKWFHSTGIVLAVATPLAFLMSPSSLVLPVDVTLGLLFPFHSHVALNAVITDYVPKSARNPARIALLAVTIITAAGLLKLNIQGPGLTESIKSLWRAPKVVEEKKK